jgi:Skp family chaperone for outer membrane proteins
MTAPAYAQTAPAAPSAQGLGGPLVPGVCLLSREAIFANARVGQAATARLQQLTQEAQAEVEAQRRPIDADLTAFRSEAPRLSAEQRASREAALSARLQPVQTLAAQRSREIEATRGKALERISTEAQPVIADVYRSRNCGLLVDRSSVLGGNLANDLTPAVVQALDARIQTITFNRESLPAAPAPAAPRP